MKNKSIIDSFNKINSDNFEEVFQKITTRKNKNNYIMKLALTCCFLLVFSSSYQNDNTTKSLLFEAKSTDEIIYNGSCYRKSVDEVKEASLLTSDYTTDLGESGKVYDSNKDEYIIIEINDEKVAYQRCH